MADQKISAIAQKLWDLNENKLTRNVDYSLDIQEPYDGDKVEKKALLSINIENLKQRPTFTTFRPLLDNYEPDPKKTEHEDENEVSEQNQFLNACLDTPLMKEAHRFLVNEGKAPEDEKEFKKTLHDIWFKFYSRSPDDRVQGSSAFEHVFVGEKKGHKTVLGCHNWLDFYYLQIKGEVSYLGYIPSGTSYEDIETDDPGIIAFAFYLNDVLKPMGGFLIGLSPEFELALYTIIYLCGRQKTRVQFANLEIQFECYKMEREGRQVMGTLFPTLDRRSW